MPWANLRRAVIAGAVLLGLTACQPAPEPSQRLTADQVRAAFVGPELKSSGGAVMVFAEDGTFRSTFGGETGTGTYQIADDGRLCTVRVGGANDGLRTCLTFYREGDGYRYFRDRDQRYYDIVVQ